MTTARISPLIRGWGGQSGKKWGWAPGARRRRPFFGTLDFLRAGLTVFEEALLLRSRSRRGPAGRPGAATRYAATGVVLKRELAMWQEILVILAAVAAGAYLVRYFRPKPGRKMSCGCEGCTAARTCPSVGSRRTSGAECEEEPRSGRA